MFKWVSMRPGMMQDVVALEEAGKAVPHPEEICCKMCGES